MAHFAFHLVPRLPVYPAGRQPSGARPHLAQSLPCVFCDRPVARRKLDLCALGLVAWPVLRARGQRRAAGQTPAGQAARAGVYAAGRGAGLHTVPGGHARAGGRNVCGDVHRLRPGLDRNRDRVFIIDACIPADAIFCPFAQFSGGETCRTQKRHLDAFGSLGLLVLCMFNLSAGTFNPFIYFQF